MMSPNEKLAQSLTMLAGLQGKGERIFRSADFPRVHRERLLRNGYLRPVLKGWLMLSNPDAAPHDMTAWTASFWEFCARYCNQRFGDQWHLSPELSLMLHSEDTSVPKQVIVQAKNGRNNVIRLPFEMSLFDLRTANEQYATDICERQGLRIFTVEAALVLVQLRFFRDRPVEARIALRSVSDVGAVIRLLLAGSRTRIAGRLAGAFRHVGKTAFADEIGRAMRNTEHDSFREMNPFSAESAVRDRTAGVIRGFNTPIVDRLIELWSSSRQAVLDVLPGQQLPQIDASFKRAYLDAITESYADDAYHSLSIEGYRVTPELIERVRSGTWDPQNITDDRTHRDALAARGYWQAFQVVRASANEVLSGADPVAVIRANLVQWYFEMFQPFMAAGLYETADLAGYRNRPVFIRGSRHVPPRVEIIGRCMETLFELLDREREPTVRSVLGHWLFGYIHPYPDGNGRLARFLMNVILASGGCSWITIRIEDRRSYMAALETASVDRNILPFAELIRKYVQKNSAKISDSDTSKALDAK